jgi:ribosome-associated protein
MEVHMTAKEMVQIAYEALEDKKGIDVTILDITPVTVIADYFMIASGSNRNQVQALADSVQEELAKQNIHPKQVEGYQTANWILLDYGDIIIHVFNEDDRMFYDLERIWKDGKEVAVSDIL